MSYNVNKDIVIDEKLITIIENLNNLGFITKYCCQSSITDCNSSNEKHDGHSYYAYIAFENDVWLKKEFKNFLELIKEKIKIDYCNISSCNFEGNKDFVEIINDAIVKYKNNY